MAYNIDELRSSLEPEDIRSILEKYGIEPVLEAEDHFVYPTCCHNLIGGSPKLYYYFNTHLFRCFTECDSSFDIFELLIKMERLRGNEITLNKAIDMSGAGKGFTTEYDESNRISLEAIKKSYELMPAKPVVLKEINDLALNKYIFNEYYLKPWTDEGMTISALHQFNIMYDMENTAIVIPHKDIDGRIVGIRGRFMEENAPNKYMPLTFNGQFMTHSLRENLYGLYENKENIKRQKKAFIFESEKSVILFESYYGRDRNYAVATCGNKISREQIMLLAKLGVEEVVLCYDKDYQSYTQMMEVQARYLSIAGKLATYFNTSIIMDYGMLLGYKDSPIDQGKEVFEELNKHRYYV